MKWLGDIFNWMLRAAPVRQWATIAAGPVWLLFNTGVLLIVWRDRTLSGARLDYVAWFGLCSMFLQLVVLASISGVGVNFKAGKDGVSGELGGDEK